LKERLGDRKLGSAQVRLCIPSFEGVHGEVFIFKTPHHPDFRKDLHESMLKVALATSAAPTYYRPLRDAGYTFVDGGVWANNPIMIALTEALTSFDVARDKVRILSVGCGDNPYSVTGRKISRGGMWHWRDILNGAMRLQSQNALGQAGLLIGPERLMRIDVPKQIPMIELDDWRSAVALLPGPAAGAVEGSGDRVAEMFLREPATPYVPIVIPFAK
jgi:patatin-like phospholipase/acyl hydrolase